tara:strand:- start:1859 stop:2038 length:180 start_codon:yes stop_codon:yes gene_type:complete
MEIAPSANKRRALARSGRASGMVVVGDGEGVGLSFKEEDVVLSATFSMVLVVLVVVDFG